MPTRSPSLRVGVAICSLALIRLVSGQSGEDGGFSWEKIEPTPDLRFHDCFDGFKCARLQVPLDWLDPTNNKTIAIAITKLPAVVAEDDPSFGGTILTNPGGPGGSGIGFVRRDGRHLRTVVDREKHWEILSWDPRGVGATTPRVDCFANILARDRYTVEKRGIGAISTTEEVLQRQSAVTDAWSTLCQAKDQDVDILPYVTTPYVARDMVEMVDRIDELRTRELARMAVGEDARQHPMGEDAEVKKPPRLNYVGFSYGTVLGNYFASMFPGRVGRVILDGVDDSYDYASAKWLCNLHDTEKVVDFFYETCFEGGEKCPIWHKGDVGPADIKTRINKLVADTDAKPVPYIDGNDVFAITGNDIRLSFKDSLYSPLGSFERHAQHLASALEGNFTGVVGSLSLPRLQDACDFDDSNFKQGRDILSAIACGDAEDQTEHLYDSAFFADYVTELKNQSSTIGAWWAELRLGCAAWKTRGKWRFSGPFTTPPADPSIKEGIPAAPLLLLSNRLDPVTPLVNAFLMSEGHPGSSVVIQESAGHCAIAKAWSPCLNEIVRDFFELGVVPENGTTCEVEPGCRPWHGGDCGVPLNMLAVDDEDIFPRRHAFKPLML